MIALKKALLIIIFGSCLLVEGLSAPKDSPAKEVWINVFIHGIIRPVVTIGDLINIGKQRLRNTRYKYIAQYNRKHALTGRGQAMQGVGLREIDMNEKSDGANGSRALVAAFKMLKKVTGQDHEKELYYTFGWSGLLSYSSRQKAAQFLYHKLLRLTESLRNKGLKPRIRIVSFSHGGNVAIQMANFENWRPSKVRLPIAELIALGSPVHKENDILVRHPMFEKIYHFYSEGDIAQNVDFLSTSYVSSHRRYEPRPCFAIPDKLTQVQIRFNRTTRKKDPVTGQDMYGTKIFDPNHIEMWSFGWTPKGYDRESPINPLPTAAIVPYLADIIEATPDIGRNLVANVWPDRGKVIFTDRRWDNHHKIKTLEVPFMPFSTFNEVRHKAWERRPRTYITEDVHAVTNDAIRFAERQRDLSRYCSKTLACKNKNCIPDHRCSLE